MIILSPMQIVAFCNFAAVLAFTPGPNNAMASMTGLNFGWRAALPQALGVSVGCAALFCITSAGVGAVVMALPGLSLALAVAGALYLVWMGVGFLRTHKAPQAAKVARPPRFHEAVLFQAANPKAWMACLTGSSVWVAPSHGSVAVVALLAVLYAFICYPAVLVWAAAGTLVSNRLQGTGLHKFNLAVGMLLLATAGWLLVENLTL